MASSVTPSDPVIQALRAAAAATDSAELRLALARRWLELADPAEALADAERGLALAPRDRQLLEIAATAADSLGDSARANAYRLALGTHDAGTPPRALTSDGPDDADAPRPRLRLVTSEDAEAVTEASVTFADVGGLED